MLELQYTLVRLQNKFEIRRKNRMRHKVLVETSARHAHLNQHDLEVLFGKGAVLHKRRDLSQPGQFACEERVQLAGPRGIFKSITVLGPLRSQTQVEISLSDARFMGIDVPVRESSKIKGTAGCTLIGPMGSVDLIEGLIVTKRHIHVTPEDAKKFDVTNREIVGVKLYSPRAAILGNVIVRVSEDCATIMHIDTDEAHACGVEDMAYGEIVPWYD